jgi:hypothetical protein
MISPEFGSWPIQLAAKSVAAAESKWSEKTFATEILRRACAARFFRSVVATPSTVLHRLRQRGRYGRYVTLVLMFLDEPTGIPLLIFKRIRVYDI